MKKHLIIRVADADMERFLNAILNKPEALGIRPIQFDIERNTDARGDSGMRANGAELTRMDKDDYQKVVLMWDYQGCGHEHKKSAQTVAKETQDQLDRISWQANSAVIIVEPELERWLWYCEQAIAEHLHKTVAELQQWGETYANQRNMSLADLIEQDPKGLFEYIVCTHLRRTRTPRNYEQIGKRASIKSLQESESFRQFAETLQNWFPPSTSP